MELLFSLAIIGVLSAIAIPTYKEHVDNTKKKTAISEITFIQICIERFYTEKFQYPPTIADIAACLPNKGIDPWGNAYVYLNIINGGKGIKGKVRKDHATNPINTLYDLYSMGKDDIILGRDGGFVGLGADF